jgi:hypothetical protein
LEEGERRELFRGRMTTGALRRLLARTARLYPRIFARVREHFGARGATPLFVVIGRGGPNLVRGMGAMRDTVEALGLPYRFFGFDSAMSEVVNYALAADRWMRAGGRSQVAKAMGLEN